VFGGEQPVQRCRNHKMRNVLDELPREQHAQVLNVMRAAGSDDTKSLVQRWTSGEIPTFAGFQGAIDLGLNQ